MVFQQQLPRKKDVDNNVGEDLSEQKGPRMTDALEELSEDKLPDYFREYMLILFEDRLKWGYRKT